MPITDFNKESIKRLNQDQVRHLNEVFQEHQDILSYFGYPLETA